MTLTDLEGLVEHLGGDVADLTLEAFLTGMKAAFWASGNGLTPPPFEDLKNYHLSLQGFTGRHCFGTADGEMKASCVFENGSMTNHRDWIEDWNVKIMFKDVAAFWRFLFSGGHDVVKPVLENDVDVLGNLNYLYKFGFMANDLRNRLGLG